MAKPSSVSYDAVAQICRQLFAEGKNPTFPQVYTALGNLGSAKIGQGFINDWRREMATAVGTGQPPAVASLPADAVSAWIGFLPKLWPVLFQAADALFKEQCDAQEASLQAERAEMAAREQSLRDAAHAAQALRQAAEGEITLLRAKNQDLGDKVNDLTMHAAAESESRRRAKTELGQVRRDFAEKENRFNERLAEMESRLDTARREHDAALLAERRARTDEAERLARTHADELAERDRQRAALADQVAEKTTALASALQEQLQAAGQARAAAESRSAARTGRGQHDAAYLQGVTWFQTRIPFPPGCYAGAS